MFRFFAVSYAFAVAVVLGIAHFGPFPWFNYAAVIWFAGFLAVVVGVVYGIARLRTNAAGSSGTARASKHQSKGARGRDR